MQTYTKQTGNITTCIKNEGIIVACVLHSEVWNSSRFLPVYVCLEQAEQMRHYEVSRPTQNYNRTFEKLSEVKKKSSLNALNLC